ncbi:tape measure protein [Akkermansia muciniphila]|uniref:tape measure protein n=1 Tax=Akkermansia muciniphila TaxID=239935 RepID=UPI00201D2B3D|nr:tape measure protein [Akkermansia muciniphila]MCL6685804.1 tape measure protein [Akkermansia muciniphila]
MSEGATIKIDGDASGFIAATEESRKAASGMSEALQGAVGGSTGEAVKGLKGMDQEGRKACKRLNAGLINMSATITGVGAAINGLRVGWGKFSAMLAGGDDLERVTRRMEAFTGGASSAAEAARDVVDFADTPPFGLAETQRAAQLLLGCGVRASELKSTLEALGNVAAGGGASLETVAARLSKAFQMGKVDVETLEPFTLSGIDVMGQMAKQAGKTRAELKDMMSKGKVGFSQVFSALKSMGSGSGQFAGGMEKNTQDIESRVETLKGKVGALSRIFAEPVTSGIKDAMDSIGASWAGHGPEVERGLRKTGELLGGIVKAAAPIVSAVGGGLASVAAGGGRVEKMIRSGILAWGAWKAVGMAANSSVGRSIQAAAAAFRVDYNNELRLAGGNMKRFDSAVRAVGLTAKRTWARMGADLAASLKGPAIMAAIAAISYAVSELYRVGSDAFGHVPKDVQEKEKNFGRDNVDFDERIKKMAGEASSKLDVGRVMDEYDAEIKRLKREEEDLLAEDPLGRMTVAVQDRLVLLQRERKELQQVAEANAKAAETRERAAQRGQQTEEARKKTLEKIREIQDELLSLDYDRAEEERERRRSGMGLEDRKKDLLGGYGSMEGLKKAIAEQKALLDGGDAVDGMLNLEGVESRIKSLYELLGKVEEVDREIVERNKEWDKAEAKHQKQAALLRAEIHGQKDKLRVLQEQARVLELQNQYEADGMSKARAGAAAREIAALEQNRNRAQAGREYRRQMALLKAQAEGNKAEERRLKMAERMKEIYDQQRGLGIDRKTAMRRARGMAGLEDMVERRKDRKEGSGPIADSLAQVGGGGRSMMGSMPQLTEARKQTNLLQQIVKNTGAGQRGTLKTVARLGY